MTAFRRFGALAAEDLLYRQAELVELERSLREYQQEDKESGHGDRERYAFNWDKLQRSGGFNEAILRHRRVLELRHPLASQIKALDEWMQRPTMGNVWLEGSDRKTWSEPNLEDMITLIPQSQEENFATDFTLKLIHEYNRLLGRHIHKAKTSDFLHNTIRYRDEGIFRVLKALATLMASLLPVAGIAALYAIHSMPGRIGGIAVFTALFSFSLSVITSASTKDTFSATAAFAAVLVVFVGTTDTAAGIIAGNTS
ncbi:hypothetical protein C8A00DRAFT_46194 [Chaetomidium leptoderma]|uniref:DUF6594 domain-containing protein n=1 Tax=Chaetomidium leptoderma TaxID=669021 RepID=A0AAN6ZTJ6_9PEZI|nr:hypothetical protein C8A00DRAFT_46194 [Chaetomidium leptoderma]